MATFRNFLPMLILAGGAVLTSCGNQRYEEVSADRIFASWGVTNSTHTFGEFDSLFYLINPVRNINDSIYYNGNYTDSYYDADSTRVTLRYTTGDSIFLNIDRMYAVEVNPKFLVVYGKAEGDTTAAQCTLLLRRDEKNGNLYKAGPDAAFAGLLASETTLHFTGTNANASGEAQGGQNYEFLLDAQGFKRAITLADTLNVRRDTTAFKAVHSKLHHNIFDELLHPGHKEDKAAPGASEIKDTGRAAMENPVEVDKTHALKKEEKHSRHRRR